MKTIYTRTSKRFGRVLIYGAIALGIVEASKVGLMALAGTDLPIGRAPWIIFATAFLTALDKFIRDHLEELKHNKDVKKDDGDK